MAADREDVVAVEALETLERFGHLPEVALLQLIGTVAVAALVGVSRARCVQLPPQSRVSHLPEVQLPGLRGPSVDDHRAAALIVADDREHRTDPRGRVDNDPIAHRTRETHDLEQVRPAAGEEGQRARRHRGVLNSASDPLDVASKRQARLVTKRAVLAKAADPVQKAVGLCPRRRVRIGPGRDGQVH